jgi:molecular chaperone DnaK
MSFYLGIDLGTSNSAVGGWSGKDDLRIFKTADGTDVLPSVIYVDRRGHRLYGSRAHQQAILSPDNVAQGFKRLMGTNTEIRFAGSGEKSTPEECSAEIIKVLVGQAMVEAGDQEVTGSVVTTPAAFNQMQSEATLRAAQGAGLEAVALLQEPIAAAMASIANTQNSGGQFLVYDIGGGTFDLALVQSLSGSVNVLAHEGINMLGGRDFDRIIMNNVVRPWLLDTFSLPADFQKDEKYRPLVRQATAAIEKAKIALSSKEEERIFAADDEVRLNDDSGEEIYLDIPLTRFQYENLILEKADETIELSRKILNDNGYSHEDIDRIVFIGGPSKTPLLRERVGRELGIAVDLSLDPMTAVAVGAAVFAESREWGEKKTTRKKTRASSEATGGFRLKFDFPARVSSTRARVKISTDADLIDGITLQAESADGWASPRMPVEAGMTVNLEVGSMGSNAFRIVVFDDTGRPMPEEGTQFQIDRTHASAAGIPATQGVSAKVIEDAESGRNTLQHLIVKGTMLPAKDRMLFRAAKILESGVPGQIDLELFQHQDGVDDPDLNLAIGVFRIMDSDLPDSTKVSKGDEIIVHWEMSDSGILSASVEIPSVGQIFDTGKYYVAQESHKSFEGEDGAQFTSASLDRAEEDIDHANNVLGSEATEELSSLKEQAEEQRNELEQSHDPETRRSITEQARRLRQEAYKLIHAPENRAKFLEGELAEIKEQFGQFIHELTDPAHEKRFDDLAEKAASEIARGDENALNTAELQIREMRQIGYGALWQNPAFLIGQFRNISKDRFQAVDKALHDRLVRDGEEAINQDEMQALGQVISQMLDNRLNVGGDDVSVGLASLMKA